MEIRSWRMQTAMRREMNENSYLLFQLIVEGIKNSKFTNVGRGPL